MSKLGELISFPSRSGLTLDGILFTAENSDRVIVHVHGSLGNFYQNNFLRVMAQRYTEIGYHFLSFNLSAHDGIAEGFRRGQFEYIGGSVSDFKECIDDIAGSLDFVRNLGTNIILQGHSLGCDRVVYYSLVTGSRHNLILLSPCDSYKLQSDRINPETIDSQLNRLKALANTNELRLISNQEYGISEKDETYSIPITAKALISILQGPPMQLFRIDNPYQYKLGLKCIAYIGGKDPLIGWQHDRMFSHIADRVEDLTSIYYENGDHDISGCTDEVINDLVRWISST